MSNRYKWRFEINQKRAPDGYTTFVPLSRNRLRCHQTGDVIKKARATAYANQRWTGRKQ